MIGIFILIIIKNKHRNEHVPLAINKRDKIPQNFHIATLTRTQHGNRETRGAKGEPVEHSTVQPTSLPCNN